MNTKKNNHKMRPIIINDEIDLIAVWERIKMGWKLIIIGAILGAVLFGIVGMSLPEKYEVVAIIQVPVSWNISSDISKQIVESYVEMDDYDGALVQTEIYGADKHIKLSAKGRDINELKRVLYDIKEDVDKDLDIIKYREQALNSLEKNREAISSQLEDAYEKKEIYDKLIADGESALIIGSNPVEINETIVNLEERLSLIEEDIEKGQMLNWGVSPKSNEKNIQVSPKILLVVGTLLGSFLSSTVVILKKYN